MRSIMLITGASIALLASPAFAQSTGNAGGLLGGLLGGGLLSGNGSSASSTSNGANGAISTSQQLGRTNFGGVALDPQLAFNNSSQNSSGNSTAGSAGGGSNRATSLGLAAPVVVGGVSLGGLSNSVSAHGATSSTSK